MKSDNKIALVFRLSALGDLVLTTSFLNALSEKYSVDWVIKEEFAPLLDGHPRIRKLIPVPKNLSILGWLKLLRGLPHEDYHCWIDLHCNLRTKIARIWASFFIKPKVFHLKKDRWRLSGYFCFKKLWPKRFRPFPYHMRFWDVAAQWCGSDVHFSKPGFPHWKDLRCPATLTLPKNKNAVAVMPASKWIGKEWPAQSWLEWIQKNSIFPVILGLKSDRNSFALLSLLTEKKIPHLDATGLTSLIETAAVIQNIGRLASSDTGLAHIAEALHVNTVVLFGPTMPDGGFGPWNSQSKVTGADLWCRPCSKDGRACFRIYDRYLCMKMIAPENVPVPIAGKS